MMKQHGLLVWLLLFSATLFSQVPIIAELDWKVKLPAFKDEYNIGFPMYFEPHENQEYTYHLSAKFSLKNSSAPDKFTAFTISQINRQFGVRSVTIGHDYLRIKSEDGSIDQLQNEVDMSPLFSNALVDWNIELEELGDALYLFCVQRIKVSKERQGIFRFYALRLDENLLPTSWHKVADHHYEHENVHHDHFWDLKVSENDKWLTFVSYDDFSDSPRTEDPYIMRRHKDATLLDLARIRVKSFDHHLESAVDSTYALYYTYKNFDCNESYYNEHWAEGVYVKNLLIDDEGTTHLLFQGSPGEGDSEDQSTVLLSFEANGDFFEMKLDTEQMHFGNVILEQAIGDRLSITGFYHKWTSWYQDGAVTAQINWKEGRLEDMYAWKFEKQLIRADQGAAPKLIPLKVLWHDKGCYLVSNTQRRGENIVSIFGMDTEKGQLWTQGFKINRKSLLDMEYDTYNGIYACLSNDRLHLFFNESTKNFLEGKISTLYVAKEGKTNILLQRVYNWQGESFTTPVKGSEARKSRIYFSPNDFYKLDDHRLFVMGYHSQPEGGFNRYYADHAGVLHF